MSSQPPSTSAPAREAQILPDIIYKSNQWMFKNSRVSRKVSCASKRMPPPFNCWSILNVGILVITQLSKLRLFAFFHSSNIDKSNFAPIVGISAVASSESQRLNVVAVSDSGVRFYFTVTGNNPMERPTGLTLQHIRLPPGFAASSPAGKPNKVQLSYYKNGEIRFYCRDLM